MSTVEGMPDMGDDAIDVTPPAPRKRGRPPKAKTSDAPSAPAKKAAKAASVPLDLKGSALVPGACIALAHATDDTRWLALVSSGSAAGIGAALDQTLAAFDVALSPQEAAILNLLGACVAGYMMFTAAPKASVKAAMSDNGHAPATPPTVEAPH